MRSWRRVPEAVRRMLPADGGRLLAWAELAQPGGGLAAATTHGLVWLPGGADDGAAGGRQASWVAWDQVLKATWSQECLDLVCTDRGGTAGNHRLQFDDPGTLPQVVRERITWTVVASHSLTLRVGPGEPRTVLLTARRSTRDEVIRWLAVFDPKAGPITGPQARAAAQALKELAAQLGIGLSG
jgi:hypothetical protein